MDKLVLLVKCKVGDKSMWMMPQGARQEGETMRQTAERVLASQCGPQSMRDMRAHFFGNAPSACFKYSYPLDKQREHGVKGAKVSLTNKDSIVYLRPNDGAKHCNRT